jgi:hypothetical protein
MVNSPEDALAQRRQALGLTVLERLTPLGRQEQLAGEAGQELGGEELGRREAAGEGDDVGPVHHPEQLADGRRAEVVDPC